MTTRLRVVCWGIWAAGIASLASGLARAQAPTIGDTPTAPGNVSSSLGPTPGAGGSGFQNPGGGDQILGGRPGATTPRVPTSISTPGGPNVGAPIAPSIAPPVNLQPATLPIFGSLAVPNVVEDEGPADGMTLDAAIDRLLRENIDLKGKFYEIPQAQADILTASLRTNPIFYADVQLIPYGQYTNQRPGGQTQYDVNISYPFDLTGKRKARTLVYQRAKRVLEAQYQDAVRLAIDNLYSTWVDVLAARGSVRFGEYGVQGLRDVYTVTEALFKSGERPRTELIRVKIQLDQAEIGLAAFREAYVRAKRAFGVQLNLSPAESEALEIRGQIKDTSPPPPSSDDLIPIALRTRPDILSYRLGVSRAEADVKRARAEILPDVYVLYQPYTLQDNTYQGLKSATSWAVGATIPVPLYNRNQGVIQRAKLNVTQTQIQLSGIVRMVINDVRQAEQAYRVSLASVERVEKTLLPDAEAVLTDSYNLFRKGEFDAVQYLAARREYNDVARQYLDNLVAHRRSMLDLNTALGQRILP